jgi:chromosome segregation ATPase
MDGSIDLRLVMTLVGMLVSVAGASAVAKMQIKVILEKLDDMESRFRVLDSTTDKQETSIETLEQRMSVLSGMMSPDNLRRDHMTLAELMTNVKQLRDDVNHLEKMHNTVHPPVSNTRKAP